MSCNGLHACPAVARSSGQGDSWQVDPVGDGNIKKPDSAALGVVASGAIIIALTMLRMARKG